METHTLGGTMRKFLVLGVALAVLPVSLAFAQSDMKVTGGGQVLASGQTGGPGDTIAFNAQQTGPFNVDDIAPAKGQIQVQQRPTTGGGKATLKFHGDVTCIRTFTYDNETPANPNDDEVYIRFGGKRQVKGKSTQTGFTVDAQDNGEGMAALEADMIFFRERAAGDDPCDETDPSTSLRSSSLGRGNVQQH